MDHESRREINELLSEALNGSRTPDAGSVQRFVAAVDSADRAGRSWPDDLRDEALREWALIRQKQIAKEESRVLIDYKGRRVSKPSRVGRQVVNGDGTKTFQQSLITVMSWDEIDAWARMIATQVDGLRANLAMVAKLRQLQERFPDSEGPAEAVAALGMTVEQWLAS